MNIRHRAGLLIAALLAFVSPLAVAAPITFHAALSGAAENPPNASPGIGFAIVVFDDVAHTMDIHASFAGLLGTTSASHIHCCVAPPGNVGVAVTSPSLTGFPLGVTAGTYDRLFDLTLASSYSPTFMAANGGTAAGAEAALLAGLKAGRAYFNIHTTSFGGGEIRGFLAVPEPQSVWLIGLALLALAWMQRRRVV